MAGIIIGDLNCGPEASKSNYDYLLQDGRFRDVYVEAEQQGRLLEGPAYSWDPENYLNKIGPHAACPGQRCDHVFVAAGGPLDKWVAASAQIIFSEQCIDIGRSDGVCSTLSDHHGLVVTMTKGDRLTSVPFAANAGSTNV